MAAEIFPRQYNFSGMMSSKVIDLGSASSVNTYDFTLPANARYILWGLGGSSATNVRHLCLMVTTSSAGVVLVTEIAKGNAIASIDTSTDYHLKITLGSDFGMLWIFEGRSPESVTCATSHTT